MRLKIAFYKPLSDGEEPWINRLTEFVSGKFVHAELVFNDNYSCSIYQNETVFLKKKSFGRDNWTFKSVPVSPAQLQQIRVFCEKQQRDKKPFNKTGLILCTTPFPRKTDQSCFFCSELIICAFQNVGLMTELDSSMTTPSDLYNFLNQQNCAITESAVMKERLNNKQIKFAGVNTKKKSKKSKHKKIRFNFKK